MLGFTLFGAGQIGRIHAQNIAANPDAMLLYVYDVNEAAATAVARAHGAEVAPDVHSALSDPAVGAVLIASSTDTHCQLILAAAQQGKAILCEKPIDLDVERVNRCQEELAACAVPVQIGFNRRYDPSHRGVREAAAAGEVGNIEQVVITSRDPAPPPVEYIKRSGGIFRDMMIHDFDLARFILDEEPSEIFAVGSTLIDPQIRTLGDYDSAMVLMRTASGKLCHINNSRRASYGYDQRVEVFGARGMLRSENRRATTVERYSTATTAAREPLLHFFVDRYADAYVAELEDFVSAVAQGRKPAVTFEDGRRALILADAAVQSAKTGMAVNIAYDGPG